MVIFAAHILTIAMRTSGWGMAQIVRRGKIGKSREMFRLVFFKKMEDRRGRKGGNRRNRGMEDTKRK